MQIEASKRYGDIARYLVSRRMLNEEDIVSSRQLAETEMTVEQIERDVNVFIIESKINPLEFRIKLDKLKSDSAGTITGSIITQSYD